jgi:transposase
MAKAVDDLPDDVEALKAEVRNLRQRVAMFEEQYRLDQAKRYAPSQDQPPAEELPLFNEAEHERQRARYQPAAAAKPKKSGQANGGGRRPLPKDLPRETRVHELAESEQVCDCCGGALHVVDTEVTETAEQIPARVYVVEHYRRRYACRDCDGGVERAPAPKAPIPGAQAGPNLLAAVVAGKYVESMPLYRQAAFYQRHGLELDRQTLGRWAVRAGELVQPLIDRFHALLLTGPVIHADESRLQVLKEAGRSAKQKSTMWVYASGGGDPPIRIYQYQPNTSSEHPRRFLDGFTGYLQSDGFSGYDALARAQPQLTGVGCWAHARRKFVDVQKAGGDETGDGEAAWFVARIGELYAIERDCAEVDADERYRRRQAKARPILDAIGERLAGLNGVPPKTLLGKALTYTRRQWPSLVRYIDSGHTAIDNNTAERAIKPFVIGRKNWLFSNSANGAHASAALYSVVETAKANGVEPYAYLAHVFHELANRDIDGGAPIDDLLPWNIELPDPAAAA